MAHTNGKHSRLRLLKPSVPVIAFTQAVTLDLSLPLAWDKLTRVLESPAWAQCLHAIDITPTPYVGPVSVAKLDLAHRIRTFRMVTFDRPRHWMWAGRVLWFTLFYDHAFEPVNERQTTLTLQMRVAGLGKGLFARLLAIRSRSEVDAALSKVADEFTARPGSTKFGHD